MLGRQFLVLGSGSISVYQNPQFCTPTLLNAYTRLQKRCRRQNQLDYYETIMFWDDQSCVVTMNEHAPDIYKEKTDD